MDKDNKNLINSSVQEMEALLESSFISYRDKLFEQFKTDTSKTGDSLSRQISYMSGHKIAAGQKKDVESRIEDLFSQESANLEGRYNSGELDSRQLEEEKKKLIELREQALGMVEKFASGKKRGAISYGDYYNKLVVHAEKQKEKLAQEIEDRAEQIEKDRQSRVRMEQKVVSKFGTTSKGSKIVEKAIKRYADKVATVYSDNGNISSKKKVVEAVQKSGAIKLVDDKVIVDAVSKIQTAQKKNSKKKDKNTYFDTETTGIGDNDVPVSLGIFKNDKAYDLIFDYGGDNDLLAEKLAKAMNLPDKDKPGKISDSSKELRKMFGLDKTLNGKTRRKNIKKEEVFSLIEKGVLKQKGIQLLTLERLEKELTPEKGGKLYGYNSEFDVKKIKTYLELIKSKSGNNKEINARVERIIKILNSARDVREEAVLPQLKEIGVADEVKFIGTTKLQDMVRILTGDVDEDAHMASADAKQTAMVLNALGDTNFLQVFAETFNAEAQKRITSGQMKKTEIGKNGVEKYTKEYKELAKYIFDGMITVKNGGKLQTSKVDNSETKDNGKVEKDIKAVAVERVRNLFKALGNPNSTEQSTAQKALSGQHLLDRAKKLGIDLGALTPNGFGRDISQNGTALAQQSAADYLAQIIEESEKNGWGVALKTNGSTISLGLYSKEDYKEGQEVDWNKIAKIDIGLVNDEGIIAMGDQQIANLLTPTVNFIKDEEGKVTSAQTVMSTAGEWQFEKILGMIKGEKFKARMNSKDYEKASSFMKLARNNALAGAPAGTSSSVLKEATDDMAGGKTPEQMVGVLATGSMRRLGSVIYSNKDLQDAINAIYEELAKERAKAMGWDETKAKGKTIDPNNLTQEEIEVLNIAYSMIAEDWIDPDGPQVANLKDSLLKRVLQSPAFNLAKKNIQELAYNGLVPQMDSLKEESFLNGMFRLRGANDVLPFGYLGNSSNRALYQVFNYNRRANESTQGRSNMFTAEIGRNVGVDYHGASMKQYVGATTSDKEVFDALQSILQEEGKSIEEIQSIITSVKEGGVIISQDLADELMSYRENNSEDTFDKDISPTFFSKLGLDVNLEDLKNSLRVGDIYKIDTTANEDIDFSTKFGVKAGDIVVGLKKTESGFKLITESLEKVKEGTKLLGGNGQRVTARILSNDTYKKLTEKLGVGDAQYLTEERKFNSKYLMETLRGRLSYILTEALRDKNGNELTGDSRKAKLEEINKILQSAPVFGNAVQYIADEEQFQFNAFYDALDKAYKYVDALGKEHLLFSKLDENGNEVPLTKEEEEALIKQGITEEMGSFLQTVGEQLLGTEKYNNTKGYTATSLNMFKEFPYFDPSGSGSPTTMERNGGVKYGRRERDAFRNSTDRYSSQVKNKKGLELYRKKEFEAQEQYGEAGLKAQEDIKTLTDIIKNPAAGLARGKGKEIRIELVWGKASSPNQIDVSQMLDKFDYDEEGFSGISEEQYKQTVGYAIAEKQKQLAQLYGVDLQKVQDAGVIMDLESSGATISNQAHKKIKIANISPAKRSDGSYIPSITDRATATLIRTVKEAVQEKTAEGLTKDVSDSVEKMLETYEEAATSKDSSLYRMANETYVTNASHVKSIGQNTEQVKKDYETLMSVEAGQRDYSSQNTVKVSENQLRGLLGVNVSNGGGQVTDYAKNIQSLARMYQMQTGDTGLSQEDFDNYQNIEELKNQSVETLVSIEKELIDRIIEQIKQGNLLLSQVHRYPSTSGMDVHHSYLGIQEDLADGVMAITRGTAQLFNGDFDGDKNQVRVQFGSQNFESYEDYKEAYLAADEITQIESKIAAHMEEWERKKSELDNITKNDIEKEKKANKDKQIKDLVQEIMNPDSDRFAAVMSRANKEYVGKFSNVSTNIRRAKNLMGMDSVNGETGKQLPVYSMLISAFTEVLEQDSISAKKVSERLAKSVENGEDADTALNELLGLYQLMNSGNFDEAITEAIRLGVLEVDKKGNIGGRQFELAKATVQFTDEEAFKKYGLDNGVSVATLRSAFGSLKGLMEEYKISDYEVVRGKEDIISKKMKKVKSTTNFPKSSSSNKPISSKEGVKEPITVKYIAAAEVKNKDDYDTSHKRELTDYQNNKYESENSVTGIINLGKEPLSKNEQQRMDIAAAKGTYLHKLVELMNEGKVDTVDALSPESQQEVENAYQKMIQTIGMVDENTNEMLKKRAEHALNFAKANKLFSDKVESEVTLGGWLTDGNGTAFSISGQADMVDFNDEGATIGDWKFSSMGGPNDVGTVAERIIQASFYLWQMQDSLLAKKEELENAISNLADGADKDSKVEELNQINEKLLAYQKGTNIKIIRSFEENGKFYEELLRAEAIDKDTVYQMMYDKANGIEFDARKIDLNSVQFDNTKGQYRMGVGRYVPSVSSTSAGRLILNSDNLERLPGSTTKYVGEATDDQTLSSSIIQNVQDSGIADSDIIKKTQALAFYKATQKEINKLLIEYSDNEKIIANLQAMINALQGQSSDEVKEELELLEQQKEAIENKNAQIDRQVQRQIDMRNKTGIDDIRTKGDASGTILSQEELDSLSELDRENAIKLQNARLGLSEDGSVFDTTRVETQMEKLSQERQKKMEEQQNAQKKAMSEYIAQYEKIEEIKTKINNLEDKKNRLYAENSSSKEAAKNDAELQIAKDELEIEQQKLVAFNEQDKKLGDILLTTEQIEQVKSATKQVDNSQQIIRTGNENIVTQQVETTGSKARQDAMNKYMQALNQQYKVERDIARIKKQMDGQSGVQLRDSQAQLDVLQRQLNHYAKITNQYDRANLTLNGIKLTDEEILDFEQRINAEELKQQASLTKISTQYTRQRSILSEIIGGFRNAFRNITDASLAYAIINKVKQSINQVITATKELDAALVDIQIATGQTRQQTRSLLIEYTALANELGRTTKDVATASNDWLRAGYQGKEAAELTKASMMLSTLGMIDASDATTYLISTLKGWKIQADEVIDVVDKLTAVDIRKQCHFIVI